MAYPIYEMKLHESVYEEDNDRIQIIRVAGGWLYVYHYASTTAVFVPWNNEFM